MTSRRVGGLMRTALVFLSAAGASAALAQAVITYHNDNYRTGWNANETTLNPSNVNSSTFGLLHSVPLDDQVDSQPLYMPAVNITAGQYQGTHDVVYVAAESNTVYAIDAESGTVLLSPNFGTPIQYPLGCTNNGPNVGINSTPVIDPASNTLYVMVYTLQDNAPAYLLHALDLGSLTDNVAPQLVTASHTLTNGSTFNFNATYQRQRPGLLLANGNVYAGFGSFCDFSPDLSRGWLLAWQTGTLTPLAANDLFDTLVTSPNNFFLSSIWMSGFGPSTDDSGNILVVTGNSDPSGTTYDGVTNIQESVIKVSPDLSMVLDLFTPSNWPALDQHDKDFGSGGVLVFPDQSGSYPHLGVAAGKVGSMFFMNEDNLGGYSSQTNNVLGTYSIDGCWCGPSYFVDPGDSVARVVSSGGTTVEVWKLQTSPTTSLNLVAQSASIGGGQSPGFFTNISSNGTGNAIIWALSRPVSSSNPAIYLYAFNPDSGTNMETLFVAQAGEWPNVHGNANLVPVVANGEVFVASYNQLQVFGLASTTTTAVVSISPPYINFGNQIVGITSNPLVSTLTNIGNGTLSISSVSLTGANVADFAETNNCPASLAPKNSCNISVTFTPTAVGTRAAFVTITDNAPGSPQMISLSGTGTQPAVTLSPSALNFGNQTVGITSAQLGSTLKNTGNDTVTIASIGVTGSDSSEFVETNTCGTSVPAGGSCKITVTFTPATTGTRIASVSIADNAPGSPQSLPLSGVGVLPAVTFSPASLTFPTQVVCTSSKAQKVTLTNTGLGILTVSNIVASGQFSQKNTCPATLKPNAKCTISVTFDPTTIGALTGSVSVSDNAPGNPQGVTLNGTGTYIELTPASLNFGNQPVNTKSRSKTITLTNEGAVTVNITSISITGTNAGDFAQTSTCGASVASGAGCSIKVTFTPTAQGSRSAQVSISDDGGGGPQAVGLTGTGTP